MIETKPQTRDHHDERAIAFFGTRMVVGLYLDGWAHNVRKPETFFSPWHFILYSGFGAAVAYFAFRGYFLKKRSTPDKLTTFGLILFIVGAVGDGFWHSIFGIEVSLEALLSPTHLALMIGGMCMTGIAYRAADRAEPREERANISLIVTTTLSTSVVIFFTQYYDAFRFAGLFHDPRDREDIWQVHSVGSVFVTNTILLGLVFLITRRWQTPRWAFTFSFAGLAAASVLLDGRRGAMLNIAAAALAGGATDLMVKRLRPFEPNVRNRRMFSMLVPFALWSLWFLSLQLQHGVRWPAELWTGTIVLAVLEGAGLGLLAFAPPGSTARPDPSEPPFTQARSIA